MVTPTRRAVCVSRNLCVLPCTTSEHRMGHRPARERVHPRQREHVGRGTPRHLGEGEVRVRHGRQTEGDDTLLQGYDTLLLLQSRRCVAAAGVAVVFVVGIQC